MPKITSPDFSFIHSSQGLLGAARAGGFHTSHGEVKTPAFMPVGTQGTVKGITPAQLRDIGPQVILGNTYHLGLRPGDALVAQHGGPASVHGLGWAHPHGFRGIPGLLPGLPAKDDRGGGHLPEPPGRQPAVPVAGAQPGDPAEPGLRHLHGPGRVPAGPHGAVEAGDQHGPHHPLAGPEPGGAPPAPPGPLRHQPGRHPPGSAPAPPGGGHGAGREDPLPGLRRGRPQRGGAQGRDERGAGGIRAGTASGPPPVPHGRGHAGGPALRHRAGGGSLRLRAAQPRGPARPHPHEPGQAQPQERPPPGDGPAPGPGLRLLHLPDLQPGLPPPSLPLRRVAGLHAEHDPQPELHCGAHPRRAAGPAGKPLSGVRPDRARSIGRPRSPR